MTPEIKQRIEQIGNGRVPEGYKKTKYGIFPAHWKVDKLGNYLQELRELSNEIEKYPIYSSSRKGLLPQSQYYDKREAVTTNLGYKKVPNGYVTYRHMSDDDIFRFNKNTTEGTVLVSSEYPVFNCNTNGNIDYILPLLNDSPRFKYYCRIQKMGGTRTRLYYKNLCQYTTAFPPLKEQQKSAKILSAQDKVIECYEKKIEQLKRMKKYYLQNMFPKRGETVPKIRFKGFTDPWEQRKLSELGEIVTGSTPSTTKSEYYSEDGLPWVTPSDIESNIISNSPRKLSDEGARVARVVPANTILCTCIASIGKNALLTVKGSFNQQINSLTPNEENDPYFLLTESEFWSNHMKQLAASGTMQIINKTEFSELPTMIPKYEEQKIIGEYFKCIDNHITLHQRKLEEEKKKKKALQQLLLTGIVRL